MARRRDGLYAPFPLEPSDSQFLSAWLWRRQRDGGIGFTLSPWPAHYARHTDTLVSNSVYGSVREATAAAVGKARERPTPDGGQAGQLIPGSSATGDSPAGDQTQNLAPNPQKKEGAE